jgi:hypothetical protein
MGKMSFDFNCEDTQKEFVSGPVPAGSKVMIRMTIVKPKNEVRPGSFVSQAKSGLLGLWCKLEVVSGAYQGVSWHENFWLPEGMQRVISTDGQRKAVKIAGSKLRAIVEAARRIDPADQSPAAVEARKVRTVLDMDGMTFPAKLGLDQNGREYNGKVYWNNVLSMIITPDKPEFQDLIQGKEFITDGPTEGKAPAAQNGSAYGSGDMGGSGFPSESGAFDDIPF